MSGLSYTGGRIPYGFTLSGSEYLFDPAQGPQLVMLMRAHAGGTSYRDLADALNAQEVASPSGGKWSYGSVARVVTRGRQLSHLIPIEYVI